MKKRQIAGGVFAGILILMLCLILYHGRALFSLAAKTLGCSLLFAAFLMPLIRLLTRLGLKERWALPGSVALLAVGVGLLVFVGLPGLLRDLQALGGLRFDLQSAFPRLQEKLLGILTRFVPQERAGELLADLLGRAAAALNEWIPAWIGALIRRLQQLWSSLPAVLLSPVAAYYLLRDRRRLVRRFMDLFSIRQEDRLKRLIPELWGAVEGFFQGQLTVAFLVGLIAAAAFSLMGLPFALLLGIVTGVFDLIPYFGPFLAAVPVLLIALVLQPERLILTALVLLLIQQAENILISPRILAGHTGLHPLLVMFATLIGGEAFGIPGMIAAVPVLSILIKLLAFAGELILEGDEG